MRSTKPNPYRIKRYPGQIRWQTTISHKMAGYLPGKTGWSGSRRSAQARNAHVFRLTLGYQTRSDGDAITYMVSGFTGTAIAAGINAVA